jgi:arylsulfatase A-like enzyme
MRWRRNVWLGLLASLAFVAGPASAQQPKPNILFVLADNIGYGDIGVYGGGELRGAPTPRIDHLAAEGLRLTQFLVEPSCTPSTTMPTRRTTRSAGSTGSASTRMRRR